MNIDCFIKDNDPRLILPYKNYNSGILEKDYSSYKNAYKKSFFPIVIIPARLTDIDGNILHPGYFEVTISENKKYLYLTQSRVIKGRFRVDEIKKVEPDLELDELEKNLVIKLEEYIFKNNKKKVIKTKEDLLQIEKRRMMKYSAKIENKNTNFYTLKYTDENYCIKSYIVK